MAAPKKLSDADVKAIRRRVRSGEQQSLLAVEYGVNRKTIRRRLDDVEHTEREKAKKRLYRQAAREKRKLLERHRAAELIAPSTRIKSSRPLPRRRFRVPHPYHEWLAKRKNLSPRALAEDNGLVYLARDGEQRWVDRSDVDTYFEDGWVLAD